MKKTIKIVCATALMSLSAVAMAQPELIGSYPEDGAMLMSQPGEVSLNFSDDITVKAFEVVDSSGNKVPVSVNAPAEPMPGVSVPLPKLEPDTYTVSWSVAGEEGQVESGSISFMQH